MSQAGFIAYVDEAGDDGLRRIRTPSSPGASEWFVLAAVVIRAEREPEMRGWVDEIIRTLGQHQVRSLHFRTLPEWKKADVCRLIASKHLRLFVLLSHKRNMLNYQNLNADRARVNRTAWFYAWCSRLLMESVTEFCGRRSRKEHHEPRVVRCVFSQRGGVNINDIRNYYGYIKEQARMGLSYQKTFSLDWEVLDPKEMSILPNAASPGLQLADVLASAFFAGVERDFAGKAQPSFAKLLLPRTCPSRWGRRYMYSVKVLPRFITPRLPPEQKELLDFYSRR